MAFGKPTREQEEKKHKNDEWESNQTAFQRLEMSEIRKC